MTRESDDMRGQLVRVRRRGRAWHTRQQKTENNHAHVGVPRLAAALWRERLRARATAGTPAEKAAASRRTPQRCLSPPEPSCYGTTSMKVVSFFHLREVRWAIPDSDLAALRTQFPTVDFESIEDDGAPLATAVRDADVFVGWHFPVSLFASAARLRWIHSASAGIEANLFPELVASDVVLTNSAGLHAVSIPEHVLGLMLSLARNFHEAHRLQAERRWNRFGVISYGGGVRELHGSHLAILGAGAIGSALAGMAAALGMHVRVMRRRAGLAVPGAELVVGPSELHALLGWADFVVVATPLTAETRHLIDRGALAAMKASAFLINIGRGESVDDEALVAALRANAIAGAGLDVFSEEPLPPDSPYWALPNVIVTPHISGYTPGYFDKMLDIFRDNLDRFLRGVPLRNVVNKAVGYVEA